MGIAFDARGSKLFEGPGSESFIAAVTDYRHLGTRWAASDKMWPEVNTKTAIIKSTCTRYESRVLRNDAIDSEKLSIWHAPSFYLQVYGLLVLGRR